MNDLKLVERNGQQLVDSKLIAEELGIQHESLMKVIDSYKDAIEASFGSIRFEIGLKTGSKSGGKQPKVALLSEDQAIFVATLSKNSEKVILFKTRLVRAYATARKAVKSLTNMDHKDVRDLMLYNIRLLDEMEKTNKELSSANSCISVLTPLAAFASDLIDIEKSSVLVRELGPTFNMGRNTFYEILREIGVFKKHSNYPKQIYFNKGYFIKKLKGDILPDGTKAVADVAIITTLGLEYLHGLGIFKNRNFEYMELPDLDIVKKNIENKSVDLMNILLEDIDISDIIGGPDAT
jgi:phage regulator Rha-like protein